jgi:hypothetical protein
MHKGSLVIVMEYAPNGDLESRLKAYRQGGACVPDRQVRARAPRRGRARGRAALRAARGGQAVRWVLQLAVAIHYVRLPPVLSTAPPYRTPAAAPP